MKNDERDLSELIDAWRDENKAHCMEGESGVKKLEKLFTLLGYDSDFGGTLHNFLIDNSGAIGAILEWMGERNSPEWADALRDEVAPPDDEE